MSEEFVNGCIQHRDTRHLRLYYDYMDIYSDNEYKAKIIRILETWTDHKRTEWYKTNSDRLEQGQEVLEPDFWITMSYQQFRHYMRHTASEDTLKKALVELESSKHIKRRINPDFPYGPPQYLLNARVIQAALNKLSTPPLVPDLPPQEDTPPPGKNIPPQEITPTQGVELPLPGGVKTGEGGRKNTPTLGGKIGTSNITTKNYLEDVIDSNKEESTGEQTNTTTSAPSLSLDAALSSSPQSEIDNETQSQGDTHGTILPTGHPDLHRPLELHHAPGATQDALGDTHGVASTKPQEQTPLDATLPPGAPGGSGDLAGADLAPHHPLSEDLQSLPSTSRVGLETAPEIDLDFLNAETEHRLPAISKPAPPPGPASHEQNRDAFPPRSVAVEADSGCTTPAPAPQVPPGVTPPKTIRATVVSPPPQVLVVSQQFTSVEDWKQAQEAFTEQLRGIWKTAAPDFKRQAGNWNVYRKQYLDRWLKANPEPTAESLLSPEERRIWQDWQTNYKGPIPLTASDKQALVMLLPINPSREELKAERGWLFSTDDPKKPWYRKIGVSLLDCAKNWGKWQSLQDIPTSTPSNPHGTVSGLPRLEIDPEWLEAMGGR